MGTGGVHHMSELFLIYKGENSKHEKVLVEGDKFVVGRHSQNDLSIPDSRLSRRHLKIEEVAGVYIVTDLQSSNGTKLNSNELTEPKTLTDGDLLDLGGLKIKVVIESGEDASAAAAVGAGAPSAEDEDEDLSAPEPRPQAPSVQPSGGDQLIGKLLIIFPLVGIGMILIFGIAVLFYILLSGEQETGGGGYETPYDYPVDDTPDVTPTLGPDSSPVATPIQGGADPTPFDPGNTGGPVETSEDEKIRNLVTSFMRNIAHNDPAPIITSEPLALVKTRIDRFKGSSAVGANIASAGKSASQIKALAQSKNLRPDFVAAAALAKLGNERGDVLATASGMIDVLSELKIQIGDAFANECVVIVAAYDQGKAGNVMQMRDTMTKLSTDNPSVSSRKVRTIWFLKEQGKLNDAQFDLALRFLALGAIAKDPAAFNIQASPLNLG